jgi:hypothetical protein
MNQSLDDVESRNTLRAISHWVLTQIDPSEAVISTGLIDPLLDLTAKGEVVTVDLSDQASGLGGSDLLAFVVVPAVATVVSNLIMKWGVSSWAEFKQKASQEEIVVQVEDIVVIVRRTKSEKGRKQQRELAAAIGTALATPTIYHITHFHAPVEGNIHAGSGNILTDDNVVGS